MQKLENSAQIFNALSDIPGAIDDVDQLLKVGTIIKFFSILSCYIYYEIFHLFKISLETASSLNDVSIETHRRRHLAYLMADQGALVGNPEAANNLPKQHLSR